MGTRRQRDPLSSAHLRHKGSDNPDVTPAMLCADRTVEQRAAANIICAKDVVFLNYRDGELANTREVQRDIVRAIRRLKPHIVVTCDHTTLFRQNNAGVNNPDHRAAGAATLDAVFPASGNRMYFPELLAEGCEPYAPKEVWLSVTNEPSAWVNVNDTLEIKLAALRAHKSQIKDPAALEKRIRERLRRADVDGDFFAEGFRVIRFLQIESRAG